MTLITKETEKALKRGWDEYVTYIKYFSSNDQWYLVTYKGDKEVSREKVSQKEIICAFN